MMKDWIIGFPVLTQHGASTQKSSAKRVPTSRASRRLPAACDEEAFGNHLRLALNVQSPSLEKEIKSGSIICQAITAEASAYCSHYKCSSFARPYDRRMAQ
jgi:hypothetical protein